MRFVFTLIACCALLLSTAVLAEAQAPTEFEVATTTVTEVTDGAATSSAQSGPQVTYEFLPDVAVEKDFVVGPGRVDTSLSPGEQYVFELIVTNRIGTTKTFEISVEDAKGSNDPGTSIILLGDDTGPYSIKDYVSFPVSLVTLEHGQRARIPVTIQIPADAPGGGNYGSVLVSTVSREATAETENAAAKSAIVGRIGTLLFITVPGDVEREGEVVEFDTTSRKNFFTTGPIDFSVVYENKGNIHLNPYGDIKIYNLFGTQVGFLELSPWYVMPESLREHTVAWSKEMLFGRYTATLSLNEGFNDSVEIKTVTFWVVPVRLVAGIFVGLFLLILLIRFLSRKVSIQIKS